MDNIATSREVFRGHSDECIDHLSSEVKQLSPTKKAEVYKILADFCGVNVVAAMGWIRKKVRPKGEVEIKLNCLLDSAGYRIVELERMKTLKDFYELIGYGILSADDAVIYLHYAGKSMLYRALNSHNPHQTTRDLMWKKRMELKDVLEQKRAETVILARKLVRNVKSHTDSERTVLEKVRSLLRLLDNGVFKDVSKESMDEASVNEFLRLAAHLSLISGKLVTPENKEGDNAR